MQAATEFESDSNNPQEEGEDEEDSEESEEEEVDGDLREDLEDALRVSADFAFTGKYAHRSVLERPPLLSPRDALILRSHARQAPFGHGRRTVVDTAVRDTWEVAADAVQFVNPAWNKFMAEDIVKEVVQALGISCAPAPRCELHKLLLYETGSHFAPHQDTEIQAGMFATIIIILPSEHSGGQVCVSHGTKKNTFDTAASSAVCFSLLAWYADVEHEVKPIASGFRLALSYKLIHTARNMLPPSIPDANNAIATLTTVLRNWERGFKSLKRASLKGADAHLVAVLVRLCRKEGLAFNFHLACIEHNISGMPDTDGQYGLEWIYGEGGKRPWNTTEFSMETVYQGDTKIKTLVTLDGRPLHFHNFRLEEADLIPKTVFEDMDPDYTEYAGYMGNEAGDASYLYYRSALIISV
ncbi:hypothetical protein FB451DRAFT_1552810 [Mycena latifolia]|nr:hypothetical protein FB451DRAFT_1552810 [Mycena latifolia]